MGMMPATVQGPLVAAVLQVPIEAIRRIMPPTLPVDAQHHVAGPADRPAEVEDHKDEAPAEAKVEVDGTYM